MKSDAISDDPSTISTATITSSATDKPVKVRLLGTGSVSFVNTSDEAAELVKVLDQHCGF